MTFDENVSENVGVDWKTDVLSICALWSPMVSLDCR